jgi:hypothetical protein
MNEFGLFFSGFIKLLVEVAKSKYTYPLSILVMNSSYPEIYIKSSTWMGDKI